MITKDELLDLLSNHEWRDFECKAAREKCPRDAWSTVCAFANTKGGHLLLGVKKEGDSYQLVKMINIDETQGTVISTLRSTQKFSIPIEFEEQIHQLGDETVLSFYIHEADRNDKPVYVVEDKSRVAYIRKGGEDCRANEVELARWVRDASAMTWDSTPMDLSLEDFYDKKALRWFRRVLDNREQDRYADLEDIDFLQEMGLLYEEQKQLHPTRAAVLLFGKARYVRQLLPRPIVDYFRFEGSEAKVDEDRRWQDRLTIDENLINAWRALVDRYTAQAERPFTEIDPTTLRRRDDPPDFIAFREAVINLLAHQDYGDHGRLPSIKFFRDRWIFHNPGDAFDSVEELLEQRAKQLRNPAIMTAFRRIGLSDQAGTGVRSIYKNWRSLQYFPPTIDNNKVQKTFTLTLMHEHLPSEQIRAFEADLGMDLTSLQADLLAFACENEGAISLLEAKTVGVIPGREVMVALEHLASKGLLDGDEGNEIWRVAPQFQGALCEIFQIKAQFTDQVDGKTDQPETGTPQVTPQLTPQLTPQVRDASQVTSQPTSQVLDKPDAGGSYSPHLSESDYHVLGALQNPMKLAEFMDSAGYSDRVHFTQRYVQVFVNAGFITPEYPQPNHPKQRYLLTDKGREALEHHGKGERS